MDLNALWDWVTKNLFGKIGSLFSSITDPVDGFLNMFKSMGGDTSSLTDVWGQAKDGLAGIFTQAKQKLDPDSGLASTTIPAKLDLNKVFKPFSAALSLDDATATDLQKIATDAIVGTKDKSGFLSNGIPKLDKYGKPTDAISTAMDISTSIHDYLLGDGKSDIGKLAALHPELTADQRTQIADDAAAYLTGIPKGSDLASLSGNPPTTGIAGMLINLQNTVNIKDYKKGSLTDADITFKLDKTTLAAAAKDMNPEITPPPGSKPQKSGHQKTA